MTVDDVELGGMREHGLDRLLHVGQRVARVADRPERSGHGLDVATRDHGVAAREGGDLVSSPIELRDQTVDDPLGAAIRPGRDALEGRGCLGDTEAVWQLALPRTRWTADLRRGPRS